MKIGAVFIDGANLAIRLHERGVGQRIDFKAFDRMLQRKATEVVGKRVEFRFKCFYRTVREEGLSKGAEAFLKGLTDCGWSVMKRKVKTFADGTHKDVGIDLDIALDAYRLALLGHAQVVAVVTHNSDFISLFERLPPVCAKIVVGFNDAMARELRTAATPIYLESIWNEIKETKGTR